MLRNMNGKGQRTQANILGLRSIEGKREFKIYDATVAKTSLKIASSSFSIYFAFNF